MWYCSIVVCGKTLQPLESGHLHTHPSTVPFPIWIVYCGETKNKIPDTQTKQITVQSFIWHLSKFSLISFFALRPLSLHDLSKSDEKWHKSVHRREKVYDSHAKSDYLVCMCPVQWITFHIVIHSILLGLPPLLLSSLQPSNFLFHTNSK